MRDFKKLLVWQRAHAFSILIDETIRRIPRGGYANLKLQLGRAADSIATNVVEGCGAATQKEFARFLDISIKSANETEHHLLAARDRNVLPPTEWTSLASEVIEIRRMLFGLRKKILDDIQKAS
jgi:four helix bundle protein